MTSLQEKEAIPEIIRLAKEQKSGVKFLMEMEYYSEHKMDFHREQYKTAKKQLKIARELRSKLHVFRERYKIVTKQLKIAMEVVAELDPNFSLKPSGSGRNPPAKKRRIQSETASQ